MWFLKVGSSGTTFDRLAECPKKYATLDRKLRTALCKITQGELGRSIDVKEQRALRDGKMLKGRQVLWMMYDHFRTDENMARCFTIQDLCGIQFPGDNKLEQLRNTWEDKITNQAEPQTNEQLAGILYLLLKQSNKLKDDMAKYRRYPRGHRKRTYNFLIAAWD